MNHDRTQHTATPRNVQRSVVVAMAFSAVLAACGGSSSDGAGGTPYVPPVSPPPGPVVQGSVNSRALSDSGPAVVGATATLGANTVTTGANGAFSFTDVPQSDRVGVTISAPNFIPSTRYTIATDNVATIVPVVLTPVATAQNVDAAVAASVTSGVLARADIPAATIVTSTGAAPSQTVSVQLTPIDVARNSALLTGDYRVSANSWLQTHGAIALVVTGASNETYDFAAGQGAAIRIPASSRSTGLPPVTGLFRFDETTGFWVNQGTATLVGNAYYSGTATHPGTWAVGTVMDAVQVTGCVVDTIGQRIARARVEADGKSYSGLTSTITDDFGMFSIPVRTDAESIISARWGRRLSNYEEVETAKIPTAMSTGCLVLADAISIKLTWGTLPLDVDSHLITPHDTHIYYLSKGSLTSLPFANLDIDKTESFGPEYVTVRRVVRGGVYRYYLDNYSSTFNPGMTGSPVRVEVTAGGFTTIFSPPLGEGFNDYWHVFDVSVDNDCNFTVNPVGTWSATPPGSPAQTITEPFTYCPNN